MLEAVELDSASDVISILALDRNWSFDINNSKTCVRCNQERNLSDFYTHTKTNKLIGTCKTCYYERNAAYRAANRDYDLKRQKAYYTNNKSELLAQKHKHYKDNIEQMREKARNRSPEQRAKVNKNYQLKHPEVARYYRKLRKAKLRNAGTFSLTRKEIVNLANSSCFYCGNSNNIHLDHIVPIARGGRHSIGNLMPLCQKCNLQKGTKTWFEFKLWKAKIAR